MCSDRPERQKSRGDLRVSAMLLMYISHMMTSSNSEHFVKVVDMEDIMKVNRLEGYTSGVRSATWHPSGILLVSISSRELYFFSYEC
jgi:WD40 repeat protein